MLGTERKSKPSGRFVIPAGETKSTLWVEDILYKSENPPSAQRGLVEIFLLTYHVSIILDFFYPELDFSPLLLLI